MNPIDQIEQDLIAALKAKDADKASLLRMVKTSLKNEAINKKGELTEDDVLSVLKREIKQRKDSIDSYKEGGREDLAAKEESEIAIIEGYMPEQMSEGDVRAKVEEILGGIDDTSNFGAVMGQVMSQLKGQADGAIVRKVLEEKLHQ